jgi:uncharacterized protein (DUF488 family)
VEHRPQVLTIGHSTHAAERFEALLRAHGVELVCDVRRHPGSRRHPQFNADSLTATLDRAGIGYVGLGARLGGHRAAREDSTEVPSRSAALRAYAEHLRTPEFAAGLERLEQLARERRVAIICAEGDWRRCHRRLIAEALTARAWQVTHVMPDGGLEEHGAGSDARDLRLL